MMPWECQSSSGVENVTTKCAPQRDGTFVIEAKTTRQRILTQGRITGQEQPQPFDHMEREYPETWTTL